ncbi:DUF4241 domain-containing protein [Hyalangium versicolor]|uniref:DUF4241 domain-containing protein n=1 Tax=Hyalangium versicolor TaxID=2861190 RepID=UPI001CC942E7|nr:DUF4241 domain-containing protein [Hyalangium versicolor]
MDDAFLEAKSRDGARIGVKFDAADREGQLRLTVSLHDTGDSPSDLRQWEVPVPAEAQANVEQLRAFAEGYRRLAGALDWEGLYPEEFPAWPLLSVDTLRSPKDFERVLSSPVLLRDTMARHWVESRRANQDLPPLPLEESRSLYALSLGTSTQQELESHLAALSKSQADVVPYLLTLLEHWADAIDAEGCDGWIAQNGGSLREHLAELASGWLGERADPAQAERLARLRERGLIKAPPPDYDALFAATKHAGIALHRIEVGTIDLPSGEVVAANPLLSSSAGPIDVSIEPGSYPVRLVLGRLPDWGLRVAAARLDVAPGRVVEWQRSGSSFEADAGLACFMSAEACDAFASARDAFAQSTPEGNYYTDVLAMTLAPSGTQESPSGSWGMHVIGEHKIAVFASGLGDGFYEVLAGSDELGRTISLLIDFGVFPRREPTAPPARQC